MKEKLIDFYWYLLDTKNQIVKDFWSDPKHHVDKVHLEDLIIHVDLAKGKICDIVDIPRGYVPVPTITFTPGVPTEDGWYVVKSQQNEYTFYETIIMSNGLCITGYDGTILSHAKLPEL